MSAENAKNNEDFKENRKKEMENRLAKIGWSLFFVWIGITMLLKISPDIGLFGIGAITLGMQWIRSNFGLQLEKFWVVVGLLFILGSLWDFLEIGISLVPVIVIAAGGIILYSAIKRKEE